MMQNALYNFLHILPNIVMVDGWGMVQAFFIISYAVKLAY